jgi:DNA polymerase-3 subunit gamma/tau
MDSSSPHYTVLARRFRPQTFAEVVGQAPVAQALKNAIAGGRVAHAYLFTGARGVGKTSMARILAKALNCPNAVDGNPCNQCEICQGIASGHDVDVSEIDGASNRRIDDIRLLRSNVGVKSMRAKYKIYIIDEVHMLTNEAFNALLKTLEEPPPNVKFIFCTTEPNKLPDTILSRCQRFDFATIGTQKIVERLHEIAVAEGYEVERAALELVARRAGGSMRDSQSLFDQLLAFGGKTITTEDVHRLLGTASDERIIALAECLINRQPDRALDLFDRALADGVQLGELVDQLLAYHRDLMVIAAGAQATPLQCVAESHRPTIADQAMRAGLATLLAAMQILAETKTRMQRSGHGRVLAELALVRLTLLSDMIDLGVLVDQLRGGPASNPGGNPVASAPSGAESRAAPHAGRPNSASANRTENHPRTTGSGARSKEPTVQTGPSRDAPGLKSRDQPEGPAPNARGESLAGNSVSLEPGGEMEFWSHLVRVIGLSDSILQGAASKACRTASFGPNHLEISFPNAYHSNKSHCEAATSLARLEKAAQELTGRQVKLTFRIDPAEEGERPKTGKPTNAGAAVARRPAAVANAYTEQARSIFGATIRPLEPKRGRNGISAAEEDL